MDDSSGCRHEAGIQADRPRACPLILSGGLLLVSFGVRLYYLQVTRGQPVWWDEAEYLVKAKSIALGTPDTGFFVGRPMLLPLMLSAVYALGLGETAIRIILVSVSVLADYLLYRIGERLFGTLVGFVAAILFSLFYIPLFYTARILTEIPHLALVLLGMHLFVGRRRAWTCLSVPVLVLAAMVRFPAALLLPVLGIHLTVVGLGRSLRRREYWISAALGGLVALPYFVWARAAYGDALHALRAWSHNMPEMTFPARLEGVASYLAWAHSSLGWVLSCFFLVGLLLFLGWVVRPQKLVRYEDSTLSGQFLVVLWLLAPLLYFGMIVRPVLDRYLILSLPPLFLIIGYGAVRVSDVLQRTHPLGKVATVAALVLAGGASQLQQSDQIIRAKLRSYEALRDAGLWIRGRTEPQDTVLSKSVAQLTYYSERANYEIPDGRGEFEAVLALRAPTHVVISRYEEHPRWLFSSPVSSFGLREVVRFPPRAPEVIVLEPLEVP